MGFKGCAFADKVLVLTGAVLSVLPLVFLISGAFMGESELGQIASPVISGGPVMLPGISFRYIRHLRI